MGVPTFALISSPQWNAFFRVNGSVRLPNDDVIFPRSGHWRENRTGLSERTASGCDERSFVSDSRSLTGDAVRAISPSMRVPGRFPVYALGCRSGVFCAMAVRVATFRFAEFEKSRRLGTEICFPAVSMSGSVISFILMMSEWLTPYRCAIAQRFSPFRIRCLWIRHRASSFFSAAIISAGRGLDDFFDAIVDSDDFTRWEGASNSSSYIIDPSTDNGESSIGRLELISRPLIMIRSSSFSISSSPCAFEMNGFPESVAFANRRYAPASAAKSAISG